MKRFVPSAPGTFPGHPKSAAHSNSPSRREALLGGLAFGCCAAAWPNGQAAASATVKSARRSRFDTEAVRAAIARWLPNHVHQFELRPLETTPLDERFEIDGTSGHIVLRGNSASALLTAAHWYLKYVARAHISWAGSQLDLPAILPAPSKPIGAATDLPYRYALNDTDDGYSGPYRNWHDWERMLDMLAFHGFNSVFFSVGQDLVYYRWLRRFGYSDGEARSWIPAPAHQPWWLLQNLAGSEEPISMQLLQRRAELAFRINERMLELGITPVLPGYAGMVPRRFGDHVPGARVVPQGEWEGYQRPDWLDPTSPAFGEVAAAFYEEQGRLFGETRLYKMDLLHEGGRPGGVDLSAAAHSVQAAMLKARPDATWVILGWQKNPRPELLTRVDRDRILIVDGLSDRYSPSPDRERDWASSPYAFGSIPNFGGHTTIGAKVNAWEERFFSSRAKLHSALRGIAYMPEGAYRDAAAFEAFSELAWRSGPSTDPDAWFERYASFRYGGEDAHARSAWRLLGRSVYHLNDNEFSEAPDSLFAARPRLDATTAATWSPTKLSYDPALVEQAFRHLLLVSPALRRSDAYRYDVVDVGRQCLANLGRSLLPRIRRAFEDRDRRRFRSLSDRWLRAMHLSERLLATHRSFLLGPWLGAARRSGADAAEQARLERDARSILTTWGPRRAADDGELHDYANRELSGLMRGFYIPRWQRFFAHLESALATGTEPKPIDWFEMEEAWVRSHDTYATAPTGDSWTIGRQVLAFLSET